MGASRIEWTDATWNPITGCSHAGSPGCDHCYAQRMANRLRGRCGYPSDDPFRVTFHPDRLDEPLRWKKPRRIFVDSMGDLFHEDVPTAWLDQVFGIFTACRALANLERHIFLLLTKRPERARDYLASRPPREHLVAWSEAAHSIVTIGDGNVTLLEAVQAYCWAHWDKDGYAKSEPAEWSAIDTFWPLPNVWLGVTVEDGPAKHRLDVLRSIPAAVRFISAEPLLADLAYLNLSDGIHWVIVGGETGPGARPMHPDWARSVRDQCQGAGVPFFFKSWGEWAPCGDALTSGPDVEHALCRCGAFGAIPPEQECTDCGADDHWELMDRCGKKRAGRRMGGREWNEWPETEKETP